MLRRGSRRTSPLSVARYPAGRIHDTHDLRREGTGRCRHVPAREGRVGRPCQQGSGQLLLPCRLGCCTHASSSLPVLRAPPSQDGRTAMHLAAMAGGGAKGAVVGALVAAGAALDAVDADGNTPLHLAARYARLDACKCAGSPQRGHCRCRRHCVRSPPSCMQAPHCGGGFAGRGQQSWPLADGHGAAGGQRGRRGLPPGCVLLGAATPSSCGGARWLSREAQPRPEGGLVFT